MHKLLVLGPPLTGKTTLAKKLRLLTKVPILDFDDELLRLNNDKYPANYPELNERLKKWVLEDVLSRESVLFFAFEVDVEELKKIKEGGFKIVQLTTDLETLKVRNTERLKNQPNNDAFQYVETNMLYQEEMGRLNLIDEILDASKPSDHTAQLLLKLLES